MSEGIKRSKNQIDKLKVTDRFYAEAFTSAFFPDGIMRLYRATLASKPTESPFTYQSVRIKNPEELAKIKLALEYLANKLRWQELSPLLRDLEEQLKKKEAIDPEILRIVRHASKEVI